MVTMKKLLLTFCAVLALCLAGCSRAPFRIILCP
ncbi:hypothetical protein HMPREF9194_02286 [Treponema maltophilum ATCC 51939]|uniref:Uncharacterized protein n=1 Tax=Treponema maltophilum ATCC 51939 TaxID=1125699 RepID=S3K4L3_TREMA|nr:hypothetical protein HMPREF9194_02286 [Treponema maltophilum ATCC 51939]